QASSDLTLTPTQLKGLFVAASVNGGGGKTSLWLNDTTNANTQSNAAVYVWNQSTLNGQTAETLVAAGKAAEVSSIAVIPAGGKLVSAAELRETATYTNAGFNGTARWLFTRDAIEGSTPAYRLEEEGNLFMPYLRSANNGAGYLDSTRYYSYVKGTETQSSTEAGVLLPPFGESTEAKVAYASGIGTVNVEWKTEAGEYEVSTYPYDFRDEFSQLDVTKTADELRRTVMAYGSWWYFIDEGKLAYGDATAKGEDYVKAGDTDLSGVVHLWQGKALTSDGKVYALDGASATEEGTVTSSNTPLEESVPFWQDTLGNAPLRVYYYFSDVGASRVDHRLFRLTADNSTTIHTVSASQGMVYDGVLLSAVNGATGIMRYHAVLSGSEKQLVNRLTTINSQNWSNQNIAQISNNLGYAATVVVLRYENGSVSVVNYSQDKVIYPTAQAGPLGLMLYASNALRSLWGNFLGGGNAIVTDEGYLGGDPSALMTDGSAAPTVNGVDSEGGAQEKPDGETASGGPDEGGKSAVDGENAGEGQDAPDSGEAPAGADIPGIAGNEESVSGKTLLVDGDILPVSGKASLSAGEGELVLGENEIVSGENALKPGKSAPVPGKDATDTGEGATVTGEGVPATDEGVPVSGAGATATDEGVPVSGESATATDEGVPVSGESATATDEGVP
ncbi:MAG: hypothetical protein IJV64_14550, partial [Oscillospiraceae bacterium]|nr:hypothetical protein [Oscillospiraceae bacterium]